MISDEQLDFLVSQVTRYNPKCGEKSITGRLRSVGILVQRERVRASLRRVDPNGVVLRFATFYIVAFIPFIHQTLCGI